MKYETDAEGYRTMPREYLHRGETVMVQFAQAAGTGLIVAILAIVAGFWLRWRNPWMSGLGIGLVALVATWIILLRSWLRQQWVGLAPRQIQAKPEAKPAPVHSIPFQMNRVTKQGHVTAGERFELPATQEQLIALADGMLNCGMHLTVREWCGNSKPFSVDEFTTLRGKMVKLNLVQQVSEKDPRAGGFRLTDEGKALLQGYLSV